MFDQTTQLTRQQTDLIAHDGRLFLEGDAGTGKTTIGVARMLYLLDNGVPADDILVLVPQRNLALPYHQALRGADLPPGGQVTITTMSGIAIQMVELFWPLVAKKVGFAPDKLPTFLSLETSQYVMAQVIDKLIDEQGYFESVTMDRNRLYSQIIDNLNKAAVVGFSYREIGERLKDAWLGDPAQNHIFEQVQDCATRYRTYCLEHNLLDFSLQMEVFINQLWPLSACRDHLVGRYHHLITDNVEEENAAAQDILREWIPRFETVLAIYDSEAGYRRFLGADPDNGYTLRQVCDETVELTDSFVNSTDVYALGNELSRALGQYAEEDVPGKPFAALKYDLRRFYPEMLDWCAGEIKRLVNEEHVPPGEIVVLAPFMSDALRFSLMQRLEGIPTRSHRPSRALREEPAARCLLTLAQLAHPEWGLKPPSFDVAYALMQAIGTIEPDRTIDLIRAQLLAQEAYPHAESKSGLAPFDSLPLETQERVSYVLGERYDALRLWIEDYIKTNTAPEPPPPPPPEAKPKRKRKKKQPEPEPEPIPQPELDHFFSLIFGEVLSQRGFGFYNDFAAADTVWNLIDSARGFRRAGLTTGLISKEYVEMVQRGLIANQYIRQWTLPTEDSVLIAPAYTFLMNNQPVTYQFWLDIGSRSWFERLMQPLTHPYVLSKQWTPGDKWTDEREYELRRESLYQLLMGLIRRCRSGIYLGLSELGENGYENQGELLQVFNRMLRRLAAGEDNANA